MAEINRKYKDSVFRMIFSEKDKLIELYNAIFDTTYTEDDSVDITTIEDVIFKTMKNDISFVMDGKFVLLVEHQSSINNNMCLRDLLYAAELIMRMIDPKDLYKEAPVKIPNPKFVVLYNGERYMPPSDEQKLSDNFLKEELEYSLQLKLDVYNINIDAGSELLEKSPTLRQYSMFVERVRKYSKEKETLTERDMVEIMDSCIKDGMLPEFLSKYGREAVGMMFRELTQEEALEMSRQDGYDLGVEEGIEQGRCEGFAEGEKIGEERGEASGRAEREIEMAKAMKDRSYSIDEISELTGLSAEEIEQL